MYKSITDDLVSDPSKDFVSACFKQLIVDVVSNYDSIAELINEVKWSYLWWGMVDKNSNYHKIKRHFSLGCPKNYQRAYEEL